MGPFFYSNSFLSPQYSCAKNNPPQTPKFSTVTLQPSNIPLPPALAKIIIRLTRPNLSWRDPRALLLFRYSAKSSIAHQDTISWWNPLNSNSWWIFTPWQVDLHESVKNTFRIVFYTDCIQFCSFAWHEGHSISNHRNEKMLSLQITELLNYVK